MAELHCRISSIAFESAEHDQKKNLERAIDASRDLLDDEKKRSSRICAPCPAEAGCAMGTFIPTISSSTITRGYLIG
jgi:hypothetical protein